MKRRDFLRLGVSLAASSACSTIPVAVAASDTIPAEKLKRIGCTTTCMRMLFPSTRPKNAPKVGEDLTLLQVPGLFAEKLGIHNVELWAPHFERLSPDYALEIKRAADNAGSVITNIQLDGVAYDLSDVSAEGRRKSVNLVKLWMERAADCGATSLRANTGGGPGQAFDLDATADSFHQLAEFGQQINVKILVENHGGHSTQPENVVALVKEVDSDWCRTAPDFGNMPPGKEEAYREQMLKMMFPYAHLASAKGIWFDEQGNHVSYDIAKCVKIGESCGFTGVYSAEYFDGKGRPFDPLRVATLIIRSIAQAL